MSLIRMEGGKTGKMEKCGVKTFPFATGSKRVHSIQPTISYCMVKIYLQKIKPHKYRTRQEIMSLSVSLSIVLYALNILGMYLSNQWGGSAAFVGRYITTILPCRAFSIILIFRRTI